jgi:TolB protein
VGADGSGLSQLTSSPDADFGGDVSADGHRVVFPRAVHGQTRWQLIQMGIDGMGQRVLVESTQRMNFPRWSPSGNQIVFARQSGSKTHLFLLDVSTERVTRLAARNDRQRRNRSCGAGRDPSGSGYRGGPRGT